MVCWLSVRKKHVKKYGDKASEPHHTSKGVPYGSVLGPLLIVLYINDLFADDILLYVAGSKKNTESL